MSASEYYVGDSQFPLESEEDKSRLIQRLRQYLEVRHFTLLLGNGCSIPLGAPLIHDASVVRDQLLKAPYRLVEETEQKRAIALLDHLLAQRKIGIEPLLALLTNAKAVKDLTGQTVMLAAREVTTDNADLLERLIKKWLYQRCCELNHKSDEDLRYHRELLRRVLLRSTTLPRTKVFTTNYDLLLERALDQLGVHYFDGFLGTVERTLRTESYHYDLYYPGETTEGRVSRVDRVLHLYKMHGSINWRRRDTTALDVNIQHSAPSEAEYGDVMIYPSPLKVSEMNGYPYSEMFRHFSSSIHQPQSVLLTIGYGFQDDHINRLIYQALSIPSFVLIIVTPTIATPSNPDEPEPAHEVWRLIHRVKSGRIIVITGGEKDGKAAYISGAGTLQEFSTKWLPDIRELDVDIRAREETLRALAKALDPTSKVHDVK